MNPLGGAQGFMGGEGDGGFPPVPQQQQVPSNALTPLGGDRGENSLNNTAEEERRKAEIARERNRLHARWVCRTLSLGCSGGVWRKNIG